MEKLKNNKLIKIIPMIISAIIIGNSIYAYTRIEILYMSMFINRMVDFCIDSILPISIFIYFLFTVIEKKEKAKKCEKWLVVAFELNAVKILLNSITYLEINNISYLINILNALAFSLIATYLYKNLNNISARINNKIFAISSITLAISSIVLPITIMNKINFINIITALLYISIIPYFYTYKSEQKEIKINYKEKIKIQKVTKIIYTIVTIIAIIVMSSVTYGWSFKYGIKYLLGSSFLVLLCFSLICIWKNRKLEGLIFVILYSISFIFINITYSIAAGFLNIIFSFILLGIYIMFYKEKDILNISKKEKNSVITATNGIVSVLSLGLGIFVDANVFMYELDFPVLTVAMIYGLVWAYVGRYVGLKKNIHSGYVWGYCLGIIGFIIVCVLPSEMKEEQYNVIQTTSDADEIEKYKHLLDTGAITQEEYDKKKKELLKL